MTIKKTISSLLLSLGMAVTAMGQDYKSSPWHIVAEDIDASNYYGITVANGMIGLVSSPVPMEVSDVIINGVYDNYGRGRVENILTGFDYVNAYLAIDARRISAQNISNYEQVLDMKQAALVTSFDYEKKATIRHSMRALRHLPFSSLTTITVTAKEDLNLEAASVIRAPDMLQDVRNYYSQIDRPHVVIPLLTSVAKSPSGNTTVAASTSFIFPESHGHEPEIIHEDWDYNMHLAKFKRTLRRGETYEFHIVGSTVTSGHIADAHNEAERLTIFARLEGAERLVQFHNNAWEELWESDIIIEGDLTAQKEIRSAIYHLYSFAREGTSFSLSPMGLSGLGYNGHVFWDTELWMYPPILMLKPEIALSLLEYRYKNMPAARQNAFSHGYSGVMFPWESAGTGQEVTPVWALTGPFQHHITGCIGWSFWKYYQVTQDRTWLQQRGYPMLMEVADFWTSRVERNGPGKYDINNVIGANEWQENIDNNAFTNGMAKTVLSYASRAAQVLGYEDDPDWAHVAENIPILTFDNGTTRENRTYNGEEIKQADVNLLSFPLEVVRDEEAMRRDLDFYTERMSPEGPAMGFSVLATLEARLGSPDKAYQIWSDSFMKNKVPPFGVLAETAGGTNPYFATGAGGMLQTVIFGFGGLEITDDGVVSNGPSLPKGWKKLTLQGIGSKNETFEFTN